MRREGAGKGRGGVPGGRGGKGRRRQAGGNVERCKALARPPSVISASPQQARNSIAHKLTTNVSEQFPSHTNSAADASSSADKFLQEQS